MSFTNSIYDEDGDGSNHVSCKVIIMNINTKKKTQINGVLYCLVYDIYYYYKKVFEDDVFVCAEPYYTCWNNCMSLRIFYLQVMVTAHVVFGTTQRLS